MWELGYKESWALKNWCFWTVVLDKTLESPLDDKEIQAVHPKGNQPWIFIWRTDAEAETPILWPPDGKSWLIWKDPDAGKDWGQEEKGTTEDKMAGWHHWLDGHGLGWTPGVGDGQGGLACCGSWGCKESDMTEWLNWSELSIRVRVSFQMHVFYFFGYLPRSGITGHIIILFLVFWEACILFSTVAATIYIPTNSVQGFSFLYIFTNICYLYSLRW